MARMTVTAGASDLISAHDPCVPPGLSPPDTQNRLHPVVAESIPASTRRHGACGLGGDLVQVPHQRCWRVGHRGERISLWARQWWGWVRIGFRCGRGVASAGSAAYRAVVRGSIPQSTARFRFRRHTAIDHAHRRLLRSEQRKIRPPKAGNQARDEHQYGQRAKHRDCNTLPRFGQQDKQIPLNLYSRQRLIRAYRVGIGLESAKYGEHGLQIYAVMSIFTHVSHATPAHPAKTPRRKPGFHAAGTCARAPIARLLGDAGDRITRFGGFGGCPWSQRLQHARAFRGNECQPIVGGHAVDPRLA